MKDLQCVGDACFHRDVTVKGWLEADNITGFLRGLYPTYDELKEKLPEPHEGWCALVGETLPATLYRASGLQWHNTGTTAGTPTVASPATTGSTARLDAAERRLTEAENRLDADETRLADTERRLDVGEERLTAAESDLRSHSRRLLELERSGATPQQPSTDEGATAKHRLNGRRLTVIGGAGSVDGGWATRLAAATGMSFDAEANRSYCSEAGLLEEGASAQWRASRLIADTQTSPDVIIIDAPTGALPEGSADDAPYFAGPLHIIAAGGSVNRTAAQAVAAFKKSLASIAGTTPGAHGTRYALPTTATAGYTVALTSGASVSGSVIISYGGRERHVGVRAGESASVIASRLRSLEWEGFTVGGDGVALVWMAMESGAEAPEIRGNGTGVTSGSAQTGTGYSHVTVTFTGHDPEKWLDPDSWQPLGQISAVSAVKGMVDALSGRFPGAEIVWVELPGYVFSAEHEKFVRGDESADTEAIETTLRGISGEPLWRALATRGMQALDLREASGINAANAFRHFKDWSVTFTESGSKRICEGFLKKL